MKRLCWLTVFLLIACGSSQGPTDQPESDVSAGDEAAVCEPGADQTCNDNPAISSLHGTCQPNGSCLCNPGVDKNPATGRCY